MLTKNTLKFCNIAVNMIIVVLHQIETIKMTTILTTGRQLYNLFSFYIKQRKLVSLFICLFIKFHECRGIELRINLLINTSLNKFSDELLFASRAHTNHRVVNFTILINLFQLNLHPFPQH